MKTLPPLLACSLLVGCMLPAQVTDQASPQPAPTAAGSVSPALFTQEQLDQLLGPIALYPDALLALILPASTNASDIVLAARFLQGGGLPGQADLQPWDESVRGLARFPQVIRWMDENLAWTKQLGDAFALQPAEVMNAIQRLRTRAREAGTLTDTAQQQVVIEGSTIAIVPADPEVIYVPYYDPAVVYVPRRASTVVYHSGPLFGFSTGFATGWWLSYGMDWGHRRVWCVPSGHRERHWREHRRDWHHYHRRPPVEHRDDVRIWQPHPHRSNRFAGRGHGGSWERRNDGERDWNDRRPNHNGHGRDHDRNRPSGPRTDVSRPEHRPGQPSGSWTRRERPEIRREAVPVMGPTAPGMASTTQLPTTPALVSQPQNPQPRGHGQPNGANRWRGRGDSPRGVDHRPRVDPPASNASGPAAGHVPARVDNAPRDPAAVRMPGGFTPRNTAPEPRYRPPQAEPRHAGPSHTPPSHTPASYTPPAHTPAPSSGSENPSDDGRAEPAGRRPPFTRAR